ncbi:MAG: TetR family transcriptional regulator [Actinomycetota bacterium]
MAAATGLRERYKAQTKQVIFEAASRLFAERGFDAITVAQVARAADVSEMTVFNHFPTKEDLFFAKMEFFEERLLDAVRERPAGVPALEAFRRPVIEGCSNLGEKESAKRIAEAAALIDGSPSLQRREREIVARFTDRLADLIAAQTGAHMDDVEPRAVAEALMGTHRALVRYVRRSVLAGVRGRQLASSARSQAKRAFARLERGFADYATNKG